MKPSDLYNPIVALLLRSPLHPLMSGTTLLLTLTGRKSGKHYTLPISYAQAGATLTLITNRKHGWWKNLQTGAQVTARVRGQDLHGQAQVVTADAATLQAAMTQVYRGMPSEKAAQFTPDVVLVKITLN